MQPATIVILDFGGQYAQLIARRVRENHVHSLVVPFDVTLEQLKNHNAVGMIFSGGPSSVYSADAPKCRRDVLDSGLPILGICYGLHLVCDMLGVDVTPSTAREFGRTQLEVTDRDALLAHVPERTTVWMSHGDVVQEVSRDFAAVAIHSTTAICCSVRSSANGGPPVMFSH